MESDDFSIWFEPERDGHFGLSARSSTGSARGAFVPPATGLDLRRKLQDLAVAVRASGPQEQLRHLSSGPSESIWTPEELGSRLFEALLSNQIRRLFDQAIGRAESAPSPRGLSIRLHFDLEESDLLLLASLPWEYLYWSDRREFLCLSRMTPVIRHLSVQRPFRPLSFESPLRILVLVSHCDLAPLDLDLERRKIERAWGSDPQIEVVFLDPVTTTTFADALESTSFHIVHFMGHGAVSETGEGTLIFSGDGGQPEEVAGRDMAVWLRDQLDLSLVMLNACDTARSPEDIDPFTGVATALVKAGAPGVVAMQFPISDRAAIAFSTAFYGQLARSQSLSRAAAAGRRAIISDHRGTHEWGTPIVFERQSAAADTRSPKPDRAATLPVAGTYVAGSIVTLACAVWALGVWSQRYREAYLSLPELSYPFRAQLMTGAEALLRLFRNALAAPLSGVPEIRWSAFGALAVTTASLLAASRLETYRKHLGLASLGIFAVVLVFGLRFFDAAIFPFEDRQGRKPADCVQQLSERPKQTELVAFETCSWLTNPGQRNTARRQELAGLLAWLLLASAGSLVSAARLPLRGGAGLRRILVLIHAVLLALFLRLVPAAHAYESQGLLYPAVTWTGECTNPMARAVIESTCCAFDVTGKAAATVLLLEGKQCSDRGLHRGRPRFENESCRRINLEDRVVTSPCG